LLESADYQQAQSIIELVNIVSFLSNDRGNVISRHTIDIFTPDLFKEVLEAFETFSENPLT
jgi:hypothetical protein